MSEDSILQPFWNYLLENHKEILSHPSFTALLATVTYFVFCIPFTIMDVMLYDKIKCIQIYKIQHKQVPVSSLQKAITLTAYNQLLWVFPALAFQFSAHYLGYWPDEYLPKRIPTLKSIVIELIFCLVVFDGLYFLWHWVFHQVQYLYRTVHSVHHQYYMPFAFVTQYIHPVELLSTGLFSVITPILFRSHPFTTWCWMVISVAVSIDAHCGYDFPFQLHRVIPFYGGAIAHDMHHQKPKTNFEPFFTWFDLFWGTAFDPSKNYDLEE